MAALGGGRDDRQLCSVLCNLEAVCSASELSRAEPGCSVPGQDLSLLPTSSPCAAAKPPLGKGFNFGFGRPLFPTLCHYAAQIEKTAHTERRRRMEREGGEGEGRMEGKCAYSLHVFRVLLKICSIKLALQLKTLAYLSTTPLIERWVMQIWL